MKTIDARGLSCPEPVLLTRQAVDEGEYPFTVLVDDETPRENILRFAKNNGHPVELSEDGGDYALVFTK
jgi:TusA-related sulfurtransferase